MHSAHRIKNKNSSEDRIQSCTEHSRATALLTRDILSKQNLASTGYLAGLLHDSGKFSDEFDQYLNKASNNEQVRKGSVIHTFAGVNYLLNQFHTQNSVPEIKDLAAEVLAVSIGSHHGLIDLWNEQHQNGFKRRLTKQPEYDARAIQSFFEECAAEEEIKDLFSESQKEILDFYRYRILPYFKGHEGYFALSLLVRLITSAVVSGDRTDTACFMKGLSLPHTPNVMWDKCVNSIENYLSGFVCATPLHKARRVFSDICAASAEKHTGLYRLDLPTGGGKTLSALRFAVMHARHHSMKRIFYIAPLLSIIEQNANVIQEAIHGSVEIMEHHSNIIRDLTESEETDYSELLQETWDSPIIITTLVQLLQTMFSGKMSAVRRFHCLCNSVILIDEVQSVPPKLLSMFNCTVNFLTKCLGTTVVLCSATQPAFEYATHKMAERERLVSEKIYKQYSSLFKRTEIIDCGLHSMADIVIAAEEILVSKNSLLIVCNTKREAAELYQMVRSLSDIRHYHLSAGMCTAHRRTVLDALTGALQKQEKLICVSTQVIEAGIDISFQAVIRLSAGLDSIVQTAGRCNRHRETASPEPVRIYHLQGEKLGRLKEIQEAQNALNSLLAEYRNAPEKYDHDLSSDAAVKDYYSFLYRNMPSRAQDYPFYDHTLFELLTTNQQFMDENGSEYLLNQAFRTAGEQFEVFDEANESVIVPYQNGRDIILQLETARTQYDLGYTADLLHQAKQFTVSIPAAKIERLKTNGTLFSLLNDTVYVLNEGYYDNETGVKEGNDLCSTLIL